MYSLEEIDKLLGGFDYINTEPQIPFSSLLYADTRGTSLLPPPPPLLLQQQQQHQQQQQNQQQHQPPLLTPISSKGNSPMLKQQLAQQLAHCHFLDVAQSFNTATSTTTGQQYNDGSIIFNYREAGLPTLSALEDEYGFGAGGGGGADLRAASSTYRITMDALVAGEHSQQQQQADWGNYLVSSFVVFAFESVKSGTAATRKKNCHQSRMTISPKNMLSKPSQSPTDTHGNLTSQTHSRRGHYLLLPKETAMTRHLHLWKHLWMRPLPCLPQRRTRQRPHRRMARTRRQRRLHPRIFP
ncbi:hypothetical protein BDR26DRAFT_214481 [Obelidium mucronatum]|nr:hypothetical protein BDR26DRAFT_214481 [Obelidium mucronatum]